MKQTTINLIVPTISEGFTPNSPATFYDNPGVIFWIQVGFSICFAILTTTGNGLVLFAAYGNKNSGPLRYLDDVVKSLALTDMLFGMVGGPFLIYSYYMGSTGRFNDHVGDWTVTGTTFVPDCLERSSLLHVTLLVFLRLWAIERPMTYQETHEMVRKKAIVCIWMISVGTNLMAILFQNFALGFYYYFRNIIIHVLLTIPFLAVVIMYTRFIWILQRKRRETKAAVPFSSDTINKKMTLMLKRIVFFFVLAYTPYIVWYQYYNVISVQRSPHFYVNTAEIIFAGVSRILMTINSCINPFIYAWTIPAFRTIVKEKLLLQFSGKKEQNRKCKKEQKRNNNPNVEMKNVTTESTKA